MKTKRILLITSDYPARNSPEKPFLLPELQAFADIGHTVVLAPIRYSSEIDPDLPAGITVDPRLSAEFKIFCGLLSLGALVVRKFFWQELWSCRRLLFLDLHHLVHFFKASLKLAVCLRTVGRLGEFEVSYTYWFTGATVGLIFSPSSKGKFITRVHGYDLYLERSSNRGYIPYRGLVIDHLDGIIALGESAKAYVLNHYLVSPARLLIFPLGVPTQSKINPLPRAEDHIELVSCSYPKPVKRLPLIGRLAATLAVRNPDKRIRWTHFGCRLAEIAIGSECLQPENLELNFQGNISNREVIDYYRETPTHFFINLSESEGMPVSIMEALSFGIPVVATAVGGVPEMIDAQCGVLANKDPELYELASSLEQLLKDWNRYSGMREAALRQQNEKFDAKKNFADFAKWIGSL